jgi:hypothetical protein
VDLASEYQAIAVDNDKTRKEKRKSLIVVRDGVKTADGLRALWHSVSFRVRTLDLVFAVPIKTP